MEPRSPTVQADSLAPEPPGKPPNSFDYRNRHYVHFKDKEVQAWKEVCVSKRKSCDSSTDGSIPGVIALPLPCLPRHSLPTSSSLKAQHGHVASKVRAVLNLKPMRTNVPENAMCGAVLNINDLWMKKEA